MGYVVCVGAGIIVGFIGGAMVWRKNGKRFAAMEAKLRELGVEAKSLF